MLWLSPQLLSQPSWFGDDTALHATIAERYLYVRESEGPNRNPEIDLWNKFVGNATGAPYCAAFVGFCIAKAGVSQPQVRSGLARHYYSKSQRQLRHTSGDVLAGKYRVRRGDIVVWARGSTASGHAGFAAENWPGKSGYTVEANTSPGAGSQFDGDGVHRRYRIIQPYNYFRIIGFANVTYNGK